MRGGLVVCLLMLAHAARADDVDDLVAQGEALAKQGEWTRAISAFKEADAKRPRAKHACLIGLAYTRRDLWAQAELFLDVCQQRATAADPAPDWLADAQKTLQEKLAAGAAAPVSIAVDPAGAAATITASSFAPDETFSPRTIHLAPGTHILRVTAPGYYPAKQELVVQGTAAQSVVIHLQALPPPPTPFAKRLPYFVMAAGGALAIVAVYYDETKLQPVRDQLDINHETYAANLSTFRSRQQIAIGLYAGAAAVIATGVVLHYTIGRDPVRVGAAVGPHQAIFAVEWSR